MVKNVKSATKKRATRTAPKKKASKGFVVINNRSYGKNLQGLKVYFEGRKPSSLKKDGSISFGKNILELLTKHFDRFRWILTEDTNSIHKRYGIAEVRTSVRTISKMYNESFLRGKDLKLDIIERSFSQLYPDAFNFGRAINYKAGMLSDILKEDILNSLSADDKDALNRFIPGYVAKESVSVASVLNATTQIVTLKELATELRTEITKSHSENWWQQYIHKNILIIQQGYIQAIDKMNIAIGSTKFPDFSLITHDSFLDILEIKKPDTGLIKEDSSRNNFYWETEISKAIIQVENYIENVSKHADTIRGHIKDNYGIELKVLRPRGIILAGRAGNFSTQKQKDDFRLLTLASRNLIFITYDELITRLDNYIEVLEKHSVKPRRSKETKKRTVAKKAGAKKILPRNKVEK
ncbi:Shedu immune nuclease family protein [Chitinophaga sp. XS-30]|uniref:Shedu immune nuclease family protein n=1 Tax=Chitinophaga sp. XS-30 TaxID=2604421 RepID=UPI0011DDC32D|nr:Shedu immune nuclease family protein [Chitinophaga sp. XS-30]QEH39411.1 DUF4263 domain-containing protein [Chitinophaga sp. XS-30]